MEVIDIHKTNDGRKIMTNIKFLPENTVFSLVSVYAPNNEKDKIKFIHDCTEWVNKHSTDNSHIIICGDFNTTYRKNDRASGNIDKASTAFTNMMASLSLEDTFVYQNPKEIKYTYIHSSNHSRNSRIDYILLSDNLKSWIKDASIICCPAPDHKAVTLEICFTTNKRGKGYWKLNNSLLKDDVYQNTIRNEIRQTVHGYSQFLSKQDLIELIKVKVKEISINYSVCKNNIRANKILQIESDLENLDKKLIFNNDPNLICRRKNVQAELNELYKTKTEAAYIRSRAKWIEQGEKNTSYFLNLEKQHQNSNRITELIDKKGNVVQNDKGILNLVTDFYTNLYTSIEPNQSNIDDYLSDLRLMETLTDDESLTCEGLITMEECERALSKMKGNKSIGIDWYSVEYCKTVWADIGDLLVESFNEAYATNALSETRNTSVMTLIFKKGERTNMKNYRPISLTNTDYKLLAHILANRMHQVLDKIISQDQTGYIKKRYIGTNIRKILDTAEYLRKCQNSGILLFLDFEKAFDTVEWPFLFRVMEKFNFGQEFVKWIKLLYKEPCAVFKNNGWISDKINLKRGIRQGCPVSALLFILVVEVLAIKLKENQYKGITIESACDSLELKLCQYADDTCLFLKDEVQIKEVFQVIEKFSTLAGPKLNRSKTEGLWLGRDRYRQNNCTIQGIK